MNEYIAHTNVESYQILCFPILDIKKYVNIMYIFKSTIHVYKNSDNLWRHIEKKLLLSETDFWTNRNAIMNVQNDLNESIADKSHAVQIFIDKIKPLGCFIC